MGYYGNIIDTLGGSLSSYRPNGWVDFRNQMMAEINGFKIQSPTREWESESILKYNIGEINRSNELTRNNGDNFTYYTNEGPQKSIKNKPILANPDEKLKIRNDYKVKIDNEGDLYTDGYHATYEYEEKDSTRNNSNNESKDKPLDKTIYYGNVSNNEGRTLLSKTKMWFEDIENDYIGKRFSTLISRFHTDTNQRSIEDLSNDIGVQAFSDEFGLSHGRNLLKVDGYGKDAKVKKDDYSDGYQDPYCRVWKWHKQYSEFVKDTMRPFIDENGDSIGQKSLENDWNWKIFRSSPSNFFDSGGDRLEKYGVMYDDKGKTNGLVNITPSYYDGDNFDVSVKKCMFSIENLAWKGTFNNWDSFDDNGLSKEQKGPLGGRIMWFPPYDISFDETTQANWESNEFIGRGEPIYTYSNTTRSGNLSFKLLIDHPAILDYWERRRDTGDNERSGVDNVESKEQELLRFFAGCSVLKAGQHKFPEEKPTEDNEEKETDEEEVLEKINFLVFWPNNYSGKDDKIGGPVDPIDYLMNGVGAQRATNIFIDGIVGPDGSEQTVSSSNIYDLPTNVKTQYTYNDYVQVGGYEMGQNIGVSVVKTHTDNNAICFITDGDGKPIRLAKMFDDKYINNTDKELLNKCRYYYRADKDTLNQKLKGDEDDGAVSYIDKTSHSFNLRITTDLCKRFNLDEDKTYSMAEVFVALKGVDNVVNEKIERSDKVKELQSILNGEKGRVKYVNCYGCASSQGNNKSEEVNKKRNTDLAKHRASTISHWLKENLKNKSVEYKDVKPINGSAYETNEAFIIDENKSYEQEDSNHIEAKLTRFTLVEILYGGSDVEDGSKTNASSSQSTSGITGTTGTTEDGSYDTDSSTGSTTGNTSGGSDNSVVVSNDTTEEDITGNEDDSDIFEEINYTRYDNEAAFFERLKENDPFMTKLLSERIRNFDPVFHSMSPEGFNARLTFLNQCMRQGPTISSSDTNRENVNNLSFGRPPVCVLRIGDFYNTKIVINSMSISYDPLVWDLNHEGIGVMPMIANINLNFNFIGGSDLAGPIQRLQNATSFNYYANTGVYDNRSELIEYENGNPVKLKSFDPYIQNN